MPNKVWIYSLMAIIFGCQNPREVKRQQYIAEGAELYKNNCANCHQADGSGLQGLYPTITASNLLGKAPQVLCTIINGKQQPDSSMAMPAATNLHALELAELLTFMHYQMANDTTLISIENVENWSSNCHK
jgi:mono/diheme cytochrome c family protein